MYILHLNVKKLLQQFAWINTTQQILNMNFHEFDMKSLKAGAFIVFYNVPPWCRIAFQKWKSNHQTVWVVNSGCTNWLMWLMLFPKTPPSYHISAKISWFPKTQRGYNWVIADIFPGVVNESYNFPIYTTVYAGSYCTYVSLVIGLYLIISREELILSLTILFGREG